MCTSSISDVIYHKFSHGAAFYTVNGENVNVMLEYKDHVTNEEVRRKIQAAIGEYEELLILVKNRS